LKKYLPLVRTDRVLQANFILGLQADTDDSSTECVDAYNLMITNIDSIPSMKTNVASKISSNGANIKNYGKYPAYLKNYFAVASTVSNFYE
jgi:hypothetical protein